MASVLATKPRAALAAGLALGLAAGVGMLIGALAATAWRPLGASELVLHASTAQGSNNFAIATGPIDNNVEGVFVLDFITGDLQCWVISPRTGKINGVFRRNVTQDLGIEAGKTPKYLLATGGVTFLGGGRASQMANTVAYVADANEGVVAAYGVPWDRTRANAGGAQAGALLLLDGRRARMVRIRE